MGGLHKQNLLEAVRGAVREDVREAVREDVREAVREMSRSMIEKDLRPRKPMMTFLTVSSAMEGASSVMEGTSLPMKAVLLSPPSVQCMMMISLTVLYVMEA